MCYLQIYHLVRIQCYQPTEATGTILTSQKNVNSKKRGKPHSKTNATHIINTLNSLFWIIELTSDLVECPYAAGGGVGEELAM